MLQVYAVAFRGLASEGKEIIMKRLVTLFLLVLMALSIVSCDKREGDDGLPTFMEAYLDPEEDFYLVLEYAKEADRDDSDVYCTVITQRRLEGLSINSHTIPVGNMNYNNIAHCYYYNMDMYYLSGALPSDYNEEIVYQLNLEGKTVSGSLTMPAEYILNAPTFDPTQNYGLVWNLSDDPKAQGATLQLKDTNGYYYHYSFDLKPTDRAYSFSKNLWSEYQPQEDFEISLEAHNYQKTKGGIVWFISSYTEEHSSWNKKTAHQQRVEKLLRGENPLPR